MAAKPIFWAQYFGPSGSPFTLLHGTAVSGPTFDLRDDSALAYGAEFIRKQLTTDPGFQTRAFTADAFVKLYAGNQDPFHTIVQKAGGAWAIRASNDGTLEAHSYGSSASGSDVRCACSTSHTGQWVHVALTYDGEAAFALYEDGVQCCTFAGSDNSEWSDHLISDASSHVVVGQSDDGGSLYGALQYVRVFNVNFESPIDDMYSLLLAALAPSRALAEAAACTTYELD